MSYTRIVTYVEYLEPHYLAGLTLTHAFTTPSPDAYRMQQPGDIVEGLTGPYRVIREERSPAPDPVHMFRAK